MAKVQPLPVVMVINHNALDGGGIKSFAKANHTLRAFKSNWPGVSESVNHTQSDLHHKTSSISSEHNSRSFCYDNHYAKCYKCTYAHDVTVYTVWPSIQSCTEWCLKLKFPDELASFSCAIHQEYFWASWIYNCKIFLKRWLLGLIWDFPKWSSTTDLI